MPLDYAPLIDEKGRRIDHNGLEICGSPLRNKPGLYCSIGHGLYPYNKRCRKHGGKTPHGIQHHNFRDGQHSHYLGPYLKALPERMLAGVQANLDDPRLLELEHEIAIVKERAADLMRRVDNGESGHLWKKLKIAFSELQTAHRSGEPALMTTALEQMHDLIERGTNDYQGWEEISKQFDRAQRLTESQVKREIEAGKLAPAEQTLLMIKAILFAVRECVTDAAIREAIQRKTNAILDSGIDPGQRHAFIEG